MDCPNYASCFAESWGSTGAIGNIWPNGYCVVRNCSFSNVFPEFKCPTGSTCNLLYYTGVCFKTCKLTDAKTCRNNPKDKGGDYECYSWDKWQISGKAVTAEPVCLNASTQTCNNAPGGTTATCDGLGDSLNTTQMKCRDRYTSLLKSSPQDPTGVCMDNTASGSFIKPAPDGGLDIGVDAGVDAWPDIGVDNGGSDPDLNKTPEASTPDVAVPDSSGG